jgi:hypothetical protein
LRYNFYVKKALYAFQYFTIFCFFRAGLRIISYVRPQAAKQNAACGELYLLWQLGLALPFLDPIFDRFELRLRNQDLRDQ